MRFFKPHEFACRCGRGSASKCGFGIEQMDPMLLDMLDSIRSDMKEPMKINSAVRCAEHNRNVGGSTQSEHVPSNTHNGLCTAVDIHIPSSAYLFALIRELYFFDVPRIGLNQSKNFIHVGLSEKHPQHVFFKY